MHSHLRSGFVVLALAAVAALGSVPALAADTAKLDTATGEVESGAKKIGDGQVIDGLGETAKGIGNTVVEGTKVTGIAIADAAKSTGREDAGQAQRAARVR